MKRKIIEGILTWHWYPSKLFKWCDWVQGAKQSHFTTLFKSLNCYHLRFERKTAWCFERVHEECDEAQDIWHWNFFWRKFSFSFGLNIASKAELVTYNKRFVGGTSFAKFFWKKRSVLWNKQCRSTPPWCQPTPNSNIRKFSVFSFVYFHQLQNL